MSPDKKDLERARDTKNPSLLSIHAGIWQNAIEARHNGELIEKLIALVERIEKAVTR